MTAYTICNSGTVQAAPGTAQGGPPGSNLPPGSQSAGPMLGDAAPGPEQTFHVIVTGTGTVSASVQPIVSNDGVNWISYNSAIAVTAAVSPAQSGATGNAAWAYFSAYVTAISGTNAVAKCIMNA